MASVYPAKITLHAIPEIVNKHNLLVDLLGKDLSSVVEGGGVGDVKSPIFPGAIDDTVVLFDGTSGKQIKASTIYADWFDQSVATTADVVFSSVSAQSVILIQDTTDDDRDFPYLLGAMHPDSGYAFAARTTNANHYIEETLNLTSGVAATLRDIDLATNVSHFPSLTAGSVVAETVNELTLTAFETGFSVSGGDTSKTITVPDNATVSGTNTGDQDLSPYALKTNVLELDNTVAFTPDADYEPATKLYVDTTISSSLQTMTEMTGMTIDDTWRDWTPTGIVLANGGVYQIEVEVEEGTDMVIATGSFIWSDFVPDLEWSCELPLHQLSLYATGGKNIYIRTLFDGTNPCKLQIAGSSAFTAPVVNAKFLRIM